MCISDYDDAKQRIETVVSTYRNGAGKDSYTWGVKRKYKLPTELLVVLGAAAFFSLNIIAAGWKGGFDVVSWFLIAFFILAVAYQIVSGKIARLKEKVWHDDMVSDDDILNLCENPALKLVIRSRIADGYTMTYTDLSDYMDIYLHEMEELRKQDSRESLLKRIDQA
jgi:hypothetical protein